jgi:hypothetical protein
LKTSISQTVTIRLRSTIHACLRDSFALSTRRFAI